MFWKEKIEKADFKLLSNYWLDRGVPLFHTTLTRPTRLAMQGMEFMHVIHDLFCAVYTCSPILENVLCM